MARKKERNKGTEETGRNKVTESPVSSLIKVLLLFVAYMAAFHALYWLTLPEWKDNFQLQDHIAVVASFILTKLGISSSASGNGIFLREGGTLIITQECTGANVLILFVSFVLAYTATARAKLMAVLAGIPFIIAANFARIVATGLLAHHLPRYVQRVHDYVWQTFFLFLVIIMWYIWIEAVVKREDPSSVPR
jgi:archaeosortase B (VPXXXP-CTERM-specific)